MRSALLALAALALAGNALAAEKPAQPPAACAVLPKIRSGPLPFPPGESLTYEVDIMGARAGKMTFDVLPTKGRGVAAEVPIRVRAESNSFFTKVRRIKGEVISYLRGKDLRPTRFHEDLIEGEITRLADVTFGERSAELNFKSNTSKGTARFDYPIEALDYVGGIYAFRGIALKVGQPFCFDAYALRRMWRVEGKVEAREHVSLPVGEYEAFHLVAQAVAGSMKREVHVWISDDAQRLPLAAVGVIDLGPVRATLVDVQRPDLKPRPTRASLEW